MTTIEEVLNYHSLNSRDNSYNGGHEAVSASFDRRFDAEILLCHVLGKDLTYLKTWPEKLLTAELLQRYSALMSRREEGHPIAHLLGKRDFWTLELYVTPNTLIPRPDTEILIETVLALTLPEHSAVLDLGTGTGAIALSLASERPKWQVTASDLFPEVIELAHKNAKYNQLERVNIIQSAWFDAFENMHFDLIVSNPPYIDPQDPHLSQGDLRFEPVSALVAQDEGMADIKLIVRESVVHLNPKAWLAVEHGFEQGALVRTCFEQNGFVQIQTICDYGKNERITMGQMT